QVVEGVLVHLLGEGLVDHVDVVEVLVLAAQPGIDPEGRDAHDLLLLVAHAAAHVHAEDDHGVAFGHLSDVPGAVAAVLADGDDERGLRVVGPGGDLALQGLAVGPLEVAQALRAHLADVAVLDLLDGDRAPAPGLNAGELQLLAQDPGQLVEAHLDLEDVLAFVEARIAAQGVAGIALSLTHAARGLRTEADARDLDLGERYGDDVLALAADQLALGEVLPEFLLDDAADDLLETLDVAVDLPKHGGHGRVTLRGSRCPDRAPFIPEKSTGFSGCLQRWSDSGS